MWDPKLSEPQDGRLRVFMSDHPAVERTEVLDERFDPAQFPADEVAESVLSVIWSMREHTEYGVEIRRTDVNWGADISIIDVIVDVSSVISAAYGTAEIASRIRARLRQGRIQPPEQRPT